MVTPRRRDTWAFESASHSILWPKAKMLGFGMPFRFGTRHPKRPGGSRQKAGAAAGR